VDWGSVTLESLGFALFCLALILKSTSLQRLRFLRVVDLAQVRDMPQHHRARIFAGSLFLSLVMMGVALGQTVNTDRSTFHLLGILGVMLVVIRLLGFFFTKVSLIALEIETDKSELNFTHLRRSPLIIGGLILLSVGIIAPNVFDNFVLQKRLDAYTKSQWQSLDEDARKQGFKSSLSEARSAACTSPVTDAGRQEFTYRPRTLITPAGALNDSQFFHDKLNFRSRIVIEGRAGIGKTWFLMQLRFFFRNCQPERTVIFLPATDLTMGAGRRIDVLDYVNRAAFSGLAWAARPFTRQILAEALILIDGLDEIGPIPTLEKPIASITQFAEDKSLERTTVVVTTRPLAAPIERLFTQKGFVTVGMRALTSDESTAELERPDRIAKLTEKLRAQPPVANVPLAGLFNIAPMPAWPTITTHETQTLFRVFVERFFSTRIVLDKVEQMPFLSTYRDIGIVEDLFLETIAGKFKLPPASTPDEVRMQLIGRYLELRMAKNYHAQQSPDFARLVIDEITKVCLKSLHKGTQQTFGFDRSQFQRPFTDDMLEQIVLESELLTEREGRFVFDNPELDKYFLAMVRAHSAEAAGPERARLSSPPAREGPEGRRAAPSFRKGRKNATSMLR
jgi:hypothetical protein